MDRPVGKRRQAERRTEMQERRDRNSEGLCCRKGDKGQTCRAKGHVDIRTALKVRRNKQKEGQRQKNIAVGDERQADRRTVLQRRRDK
jgi:hypothetical protein